MTKIQELQRRALLKRQAAELHRQQANRFDEDARLIDDGLSDAEIAECKLMLQNLNFRIKNTILEMQLSRLKEGGHAII